MTLPPSLDGQISSSRFLVHCSDIVRRQSRWLLAQTALCRLTHTEDQAGKAHRLTWHVPTGLGPVSGLSVLQTNPPAFSWWLFNIHCSLYLKMPALNESIQNLVRTYETDY